MHGILLETEPILLAYCEENEDKWNTEDDSHVQGDLVENSGKVFLTSFGGGPVWDIEEEVEVAIVADAVALERGLNLLQDVRNLGVLV